MDDNLKKLLETLSEGVWNTRERSAKKILKKMLESERK